jgi:hypothetical protein
MAEQNFGSSIYLNVRYLNLSIYLKGKRYLTHRCPIHLNDNQNFSQFTAAFAKTSNALLSIDADAITGFHSKLKGWRLMHLFYKTSSFITSKGYINWYSAS